MLLSESEAFWLAILNQDLASRGAFCDPARTAPDDASSHLSDSKSPGQRSVDEIARQSGSRNDSTSRSLEPVSEAQSADEGEPAGGTWVYEAIQAHAASFGVSRKPEFRRVKAGAAANLPADIVWAIPNGHVLSTDEFQEVCRAIPEQVAAARGRVSSASDTEASCASFDEGLDAVLACVVCGYAASSPSCLYGVTESGAPCVTLRILPRQRGLNLSLLQLLSSSIPLPALERLAMAAAAGRVDSALRTWAPSVIALEAPVGRYKPGEAEATFQEFQRSNASSEGWQLGEQMSRLLRSVSEYREEACSIADDIDSADDEAISLEILDVEGDLKDVEVSDAGNQNPEDIAAMDEQSKEGERASGANGKDALDSAEVLWPSPSSVAPLLLDEWLVIVTGAGRGLSATRGPLDAELHEDEADYMDQMLGSFFTQATDVAARCREYRLPGVAEMVSAAIDAVPKVSPLRLGMSRGVSAVYRELAEAFAKSHQYISDAMRVAYGELRLRELKWDEHGLPAPALSGWTRQNENIRAAIKVAIDQLNCGLRPYNVLTQLAPAVQSLLSDLATRHLSTVGGVTSGGLLRALKDKLRETNDENLREAVRIADALNTIRNRVVHEPELSWDRDHAAFFLNGISILLRSV